MTNKRTRHESELSILKSFLTVKDAAGHLSKLYNEEVGEAHVLRMALDGQLKLSINFVNYAFVKCGEVILADDEVSKITSYSSTHIYEKRLIKHNNKVKKINGVWDLPMIGAEKLAIEHKYQLLTGGPEVKIVNLDGFFIESEAGEVCQLYIRKLEEENRNLPYEDPAHFAPVYTLPDDCVLVVRTQSLIDLQERFSSEKFSQDRPLGPTERRSLLKMILAMAVDGYGYDSDASKSPLPQEIVTAAAKNDHSINVDTVRKWLKEAASLEKDPE